MDENKPEQHKPVDEFKARVMLAEAEIAKIYKKFNLKPVPAIVFPGDTTPVIKLAILVLDQEGGIVKIQYEDLRDQPETVLDAKGENK